MQTLSGLRGAPPHSPSRRSAAVVCNRWHPSHTPALPARCLPRSRPRPRPPPPTCLPPVCTRRALPWRRRSTPRPRPTPRSAPPWPPHRCVVLACCCVALVCMLLHACTWSGGCMQPTVRIIVWILICPTAQPPARLPCLHCQHDCMPLARTSRCRRAPAGPTRPSWPPRWRPSPTRAWRAWRRRG